VTVTRHVSENLVGQTRELGIASSRRPWTKGDEACGWTVIRRQKRDPPGPMAPWGSASRRRCTDPVPWHAWVMPHATAILVGGASIMEQKEARVRKICQGVRAKLLCYRASRYLPVILDGNSIPESRGLRLPPGCTAVRDS
jgi:hypothetical protein